MAVIIGRIEAADLARIYSNAFTRVLELTPEGLAPSVETGKKVARAAVQDFIKLVESELVGG